MDEPKDDNELTREKLNRAVSGLEEVLETLHDDARAYAAISAAIAFVEVVLDRRLPERPTTPLERPTEAVTPHRDTR